MTTIPFSPTLAAELAERERWHNESRAQRLAAARVLLVSAQPPMELRRYFRLVPYQTLEGARRWRKVAHWGQFPVG